MKFNITVQKPWDSVLSDSEKLGGPSPFGNSKWGDFRKCPYLFYWKHVKRMRSTHLSDPLEIGGLYHEMRARYYSTYLTCEAIGNMNQKDVDQQCLGSARDLLSKVYDVAPHTANIAGNLFDAWVVLYGPGMPGDDRRDTYEVEPLFEVTEPFPYSARIDRWGISEFGPVITEIKTGARRDGYLLQSYPLDPQFIGQVYLWKRCREKQYGKLESFFVDLATKTSPVSCYREPVEIDKKVMKHWEKSMMLHHSNLVQCKASRLWAQNHGYQCRYCELVEHCSSGKQDSTDWVKKKNGEY